MKNLRQLKDLIKNMAKENNINAQILLRNYMLERLLERISLSEFKDKFILKGGMLVAALVGVDMRSTLDMDATIKAYPVTKESIENVFNSILSIKIDDGVDMKIKSIEEIRDKDEYNGFSDPKACFKSLKGVGGSKLAGITPIQPILTMDKNDKRFIESYNVTDKLDGLTNLAAIPWEDFEHLIRELFEKEFSYNGGEVKITQASRDRGVDAIAFDPDPIRGGKIVIQAKRYTNTVEVSAVRDLYGTVMNEGANKGILVTTADYGPDAYDFAKNKPLTLLNGGNLLHLLEKHGHKAKIDLK